MGRIAVIAFTFPPTSGIGGRRWAKFCKDWQRNDVDFVVYTAYGSSTLPPSVKWKKDIESYSDRIHSIPGSFYKHLGSIPANKIQSLQYRLALFLNKRNTSGNYYDRSQSFGKEICRTLLPQIEDGSITHVVATGAPFHHLYELAELRKKKDFHLTVDFRDPWTINRTAYGFENLPASRQKEEQRMERCVLEAADLITGVSSTMLDQMLEDRGIRRDHVMEIPNSWDGDDLQGIEDQPLPENKLRLTFAGTYYGTSNYLLPELDEALDQLSHKDPKGYSELEMVFYGSATDELLRLTEKHSCMHFRGSQDIGHVMKELKGSHAGLLFLTKDINYSISTKFLEYMNVGIPVVVFGPEVGSTELVNRHNMGLGISPGNFYNGLTTLLEKWRTDEFWELNPDFRSRYELSVVSKRLLEHLNKAPQRVS